MLLLVFFLSHVDDSHDKVLKLALLKQLLSKVNLNLPIERPAVFIFNEAPNSRGFGQYRERAYLCQPGLARVHVSSHVFRRVYVDVHACDM